MSDRDEFYRRFSQSYDKLHLSEKQDDLVERVARAMWEAVGADPHDFWADDFRAYECQARAAIALALEEAAKVVALMPRTYSKVKEDHDVLGIKGTWTFTLNNGPAQCAAAIRALIPQESA